MKLAVFDIDGVLYDGHTVYDVIKRQEGEGFIKNGTWKKIENELVAYKSGEKSYKDAANSMLTAYLASLKGKTYEEVKAYIQVFIKSEHHKFYPYFQRILPILKKTHDIYLLTTNLHATAETLVEYLSLKGFLSTEEEIIDGIYTGKIKRSLAGNKHIIEELLKKYPFEGSVAVGDSVNDISMLERVEHPICINPDYMLKLHAKKLHWQIVDENSITKHFSEILLG